MRLIDADALLEVSKSKQSEKEETAYNFLNCAQNPSTEWDCVEDMIENAPTIEPEVRHGLWILCEDQHGVDNDNNNYAYFCSQCHYQDVHSKYAKVNFCWNCGARMDADHIADASKKVGGAEK